LEESVQELTAAIASGDTEAFTRFYRGRFDQMYAEARQATGRDEAFCLDVVQDAMIRVIRSLRPMDGEASFRAWLRAVVHCCAYDRLRADRRRARRERAAAEARAAEAPDDDLADKLAWLRRELASLDGQQARLLVMRYRLGWTLQRIGGVLGLKPGAVDGRLNRAVKTLRRRGEEQFHE
jgi:RNA polymerase sigma-70 factor (ECF subfamily)